MGGRGEQATARNPEWPHGRTERGSLPTGNGSSTSRWNLEASSRIVVQSYPAWRGKRQVVSVGGGSQPRWEGHEIFYVAADGYLTAVRAVPSADGQNIELASSPDRLFPAPVESSVQGGIAYTYAVFRDGRQFLF